jgi:hypothetical protein
MKSLRFAACHGLATTVLSGLCATLAAAPVAGPLKVSGENPRYFADGAGRTVLLTGSHTWNSLQDITPTNAPAAFDFAEYLNFLEKHGHNFIRLWRWELVMWDTSANQEKNSRTHSAEPHPWARTGPGLALDGKPKFDLTKFEPAYFDRLRSRVAAAGERGIYVSIMLFEGWGLRFAPGGWRAHPFHPGNNINETGPDVEHVRQGIELLTLSSRRVTALQEAYVDKVIETVNDLDNVLYEIANEADFGTTDWQYHMIRHIKNRESTRPRQHPVGMTSIGYGVDDLDRLLKSPADWISPNPDRFDYKTNPPASDGAKVILPDTDHLWGVGGDVAWVWKSVLRGLNPIFMDPYQRDILNLGSDAEFEKVRRNMGWARELSERLDLAKLRPLPKLASTSFCLAQPGVEYAVYVPEGGEFSVDLSGASGKFAARWLSVNSGKVTNGEAVSGGAQRTLTPPFPGPAVLHLFKQ